MCHRFTVRSNLNKILQAFAAESRPEYQWLPRYNVAPTQTA